MSDELDSLSPVQRHTVELADGRRFNVLEMDAALRFRDTHPGSAYLGLRSIPWDELPPCAKQIFNQERRTA